MRNTRPFVSMAVVSLTVILAACGGSMSNAPRSIQSLAVSPSAADAQSFPGGQVQFSATGFYNTQPSPVSSIPATWGVCFQNAPTTAVTISNNGLAQCTAAASGAYTVFAYDFPDPACFAITACGGGCAVTGTAQLNCP